MVCSFCSSCGECGDGFDEDSMKMNDSDMVRQLLDHAGSSSSWEIHVCVSRVSPSMASSGRDERWRLLEVIDVLVLTLSLPCA